MWQDYWGLVWAVEEKYVSKIGSFDKLRWHNDWPPPPKEDLCMCTSYETLTTGNSFGYLLLHVSKGCVLSTCLLVYAEWSRYHDCVLCSWLPYWILKWRPHGHASSKRQLPRTLNNIPGHFLSRNHHYRSNSSTGIHLAPWSWCFYRLAQLGHSDIDRAHAFGCAAQCSDSYNSGPSRLVPSRSSLLHYLWSVWCWLDCNWW